MDTRTPLGPGWWLARLIASLGERRAYYDLRDAYVSGSPPLPDIPHAHREAYQRLLRLARVNFAELVVEAVRERMRVVGFRSGASGDSELDSIMWGIWQANALDADQQLVDRASLGMGDAYVIVGPVDDDTGAPLITPEDPRQVITAHDPSRRRKVTAALKVYRDEVDGSDVAKVFLPGRVVTARRAPSVDGTFAYDAMGWTVTGDEDLVAVDGVPVPVVPVVRFSNRASGDASAPGRSELDGSIDTLDRINHMVLQRVVIATAQAFRQRAVRGSLPTKDELGNDIDYGPIFAPDPGALWQLPDGVDIWESQQADLGPILSSVRHDVQDLAASTRTPLFYLTPDAANGSAEGASLAREGLIHKVGDRIASASESWEQVSAVALRFAGITAPSDIEAIWQPPERFSLAERYDAASKAAGAGVPWGSVMSDVLQFTPQQVERMRAEKAAETLLTGA